MKKKIGVYIGNIHSDHPSRVLEGIYDEYSKKEGVSVHIWIGAESSMFFDNKIREKSNYDYQYLSMINYEDIDDADINLVSYGSLFALQDKNNKKDYIEIFNKKPCVVLEDTIKPNKGAFILSKNYEGMYENVNHLIKVHGYSKIFFLALSNENQDSEERLQAYIDCMINHGLEVTDSMIIHGDSSEYVDSTVAEIFDNNIDIDAIVSANDEMTAAIYRECEKRGLQVGASVGVTGFDDMEVASMAHPPLTTVRQNSYKLGTSAAQMSADYINGKSINSKRIPVKFIKRCSCGCVYIDKGQETKENLQFVGKNLRKELQKHLVGPFLVRELTQRTDDEGVFFQMIGDMMYEAGAKSSYMYLLPQTRIIKKDNVIQKEDELLLVLSQNKKTINSYSRNEAIIVRNSNGLFIDDDKESDIYFVFLLYDGEEQYGILGAKIAPNQVPYFNNLSLQIGTALRFLNISQEEKQHRLELEQKNHLLSFHATNDALTKIMNRRGVTQAFEKMTSNNIGDKAYILLADLDHLKQINDKYGHAEGDFAIKTVAELLELCLSKNSNKAIVGRIGGDEYMISFLARDMDVKCIDDYVINIKSTFDTYNESCNKPYYINISIGIAEFICDKNTELEREYSIADKKLYFDKKTRRNDISK